MSGKIFSVKELGQLTGKERNDALIQGAKEEGKVVFYTSTAPEDVQSLLLAFEMRYPFIKGEMVRDKGVVLRDRIVQESQSGASPADVIEVNDLNLGKLKQRGLLCPYVSPAAECYPEELHESENFWVAEQKNFLVLAWNPNLVEADAVPHDYDGLLDPRLKGKIAAEAHDASWMATLMLHWGEKKGMDFFRAFGRQVGHLRVGHQIIAEQIAAGSVAISPLIHSNNSEWLKRRNLPIDWRPLEPVEVEFVGAGLAAEAPHPHAALLLIDFILSFEGQRIYRHWKRVTCHPDVEPDPPYMSQGFQTVMFDAQAFLQREDEYEKLWRELVLEPAEEAAKRKNAK